MKVAPIRPHIQALAQTTYCMGFWQVARNTKHDNSHYLISIPMTFRLIRGGQLIVFHDDPEMRAFFERCAARFSVRMHAVQIATDALPAYPLSARFLEGCKAFDIDRYKAAPRARAEKGVVHYQRDYQMSGEEAYRRVLSIWLSKIALVARHAAADNPFETPDFAWIDASLSRFNGRRAGWNIRHQVARPGQMSHFANTMRYQGKHLPLNASFLLASRPVWQEIDTAFSAMMEAKADTPYPHDEETLFGFLHAERPDLFHLIGPKYSARKDRYHTIPHKLRRQVERLRLWRGAV